MTNPSITELIYRYQDASVPPPYHRSFEIRIDTEKITLVVDSYGSILAMTEQASPPDIMVQLSQWIAQNHITAIHGTAHDINTHFSTGAGTHFLTLFNEQEVIFEADTAAHENNDNARLAGDIESFAHHIKRCVKDFEQYIH